MAENYMGYRKYDQPQYADQYGPRSGPGGFPLHGYSGQVQGQHGLSYTPITGGAAPQGMPPGLQGSSGYAAVAGSIMGGTAEAEKMLRKAAAYDYAHRSGGLMRAFQDYQGDLTGDITAQGMSPDVVKRMVSGRRADTLSRMGEAGAVTQSSLYAALAELMKGTGSELADLKMNEIDRIFQMFAARKARKQASKNANMSFLGDVAGLAATAINPAAGLSTTFSRNQQQDTGEGM